MTDVDMNNCPVGLTNRKEIEYTKDKLMLMVEHLEEKLTNVKDELSNHMEAGFSNVNDKLDTLDKRLTALEDNIDTKIDARIETKRNKVAFGAWKWILTGMLVPVVVAVVTAAVKLAVGV